MPTGCLLLSPTYSRCVAAAPVVRLMRSSTLLTIVVMLRCSTGQRATCEMVSCSTGTFFVFSRTALMSYSSDLCGVAEEGNRIGTHPLECKRPCGRAREYTVTLLPCSWRGQHGLKYRVSSAMDPAGSVCGLRVPLDRWSPGAYAREGARASQVRACPSA